MMNPYFLLCLWYLCNVLFPKKKKKNQLLSRCSLSAIDTVLVPRPIYCIVSVNHRYLSSLVSYPRTQTLCTAKTIIAVRSSLFLSVFLRSFSAMSCGPLRSLCVNLVSTISGTQCLLKEVNIASRCLVTAS